jgi:hypothetical protein
VLDTGQLEAERPAALNPAKVKRFPILGEAIYRARLHKVNDAGCLNAYIPTVKICLRSLTGRQTQTC